MSIKSVKIGDRFRYVPQVSHKPNEERIIRITKIYKHPRWGDTRYEIIDEKTKKKQSGFLLSNFQVPAITRIRRR